MAQISSIFNFLKDYNEISNPVITEIDKHRWSLKLSNLPQIKEVWSVYNIQDFDSLKVLEVKRPVLEPCPIPDELIINWLDGNWKNLNVEEISYKEVITTELLNEDGTISKIDENFIDNEERINLFEEWIKKRNSWRSIEIPKEQGLQLYNNLFKLYSDMKKESESVELILGDGYIHWISDARVIDHPVLLQRVLLEFNTESPSFIIKCEEIKTELYTPMLRVIPSINQSMLSDIIQDIETSSYNIADIANTKKLFERLINVIDEKGRYVEDFQNDHKIPMIKSEPVLFLRKRTLGFSTFIEKIIEDINKNEDIVLPDFFENMIGNYKEHNDDEVIDENWNKIGIDQDVLLTLPANNEQLKIIKYLNNYGAVLVQGPPGTGKTHTIANLIGHLLSQGNSVLVTSHTEKALTVLKEKVYKDEYNKDVNLQSLCISLLSSSSQKKEMDTAINEIASKSTTLDLHESKKKIENLEDQRKELIEKSKECTKKLLQIRGLEYKDIVFDNQTITPIEAAKFIKDGIGKIDYIPGKTNDDTVGLPISIDELRDLYYSNGQISLMEEELLDKNLPGLEKLWSVENFRINVNGYIELTEKLKDWQPKFILKSDVKENVLLDLIEKAQSIQSELDNMEEYQLSIIDKTIKDSIYNSLWASVFEEFDILYENYEKYRKICFEKDYNIPEKIISEDSVSILNEIIDSGKEIPISLFTKVTKPKWKNLSDEITVNSKTIEKRVDFEEAKAIISYELQRKRLIIKINKLLNELSGKIVLDEENFEEKMMQYSKKIKVSLGWYENIWLKYINNLSEFCIDKAKFESINTFDIDKPMESIKKVLTNVFISDLKDRYNLETLTNLKSEWEQYILYLDGYKTFGHPLDMICCAASEKNINNYKEGYSVLLNIYGKKEIYNKRYALINNLKSIAPDWANEIRNRNGIHGENCLPEDIELAWKWRQLNNQLERIDSYNQNDIQKELRKINDLLIQNARKLAYEKAWYEKIKNKTQAQTQAIMGWSQTIRQVGKATGKTAPTLLKKARELMPLCQSAIPVWIMPLNRVVENFDPQKNKFDVVIIDEASQADILALSALYLGKKVIIVGDDEQVSPDSVGIKTVEIDALIEQHLQGIPNSHLFNGKTSVYDMAKASGFKPLMLTEHFRCLPEIIEFSNQLSYNGRIKPLRDSSSVKLKPSVIEYRVPNGCKSVNKTNRIEAEHIASVICSCIQDEAYKGKTIGVISLLGQEQAYEIDRLLQVNIDPKEYENRRIQCGTPPQFQGDERDIIFLSLVEGPTEKGGPVRLLSEDGKNDLVRKRYNVAASRAKDQMWVVHSLNPEIDLKPDDIRLKLIKYAINPSVKKDEKKLKAAESDFEKQVMNTLLNQGYKVIPQWNVGAYRIDMVVEDEDNRIAMECDGEKWHTQDDLPNDLKRQAILERLGWKFIRIRGSAFYRCPEETMKWVMDELASYDIKPNFALAENAYEMEDLASNENIENIKRRAEEIRREWHGEIINSEHADNEDDFSSISLEQEKKNDESTDIEGLNTDIKIIKSIKSDIEIAKSEVSSSKEHVKTNPLDTTDNVKSNTKDKVIVNSKNINSKNGIKANYNDTVKRSNEKPLFDFRKSNEEQKILNNGRIDIKQRKNSRSIDDKNFDIGKDKKEPLFDFRKK